MKRALGIAGIAAGVLGVAWIAVAWFVLPVFMLHAEESGRALSGLERLLFSGQRVTQSYWILLAPLALALGVGGAMLLAGSSSEPPSD
ncbi:MAG: hypothetical protein R3F62_16480 [Planctomycetota bacterium]